MDEGQRGYRTSTHRDPTSNCIGVRAADDASSDVVIADTAAGWSLRWSLRFTNAEFAAFVAGVKDGEFDDLIRGGA